MAVTRSVLPASKPSQRIFILSFVIARELSPNPQLVWPALLTTAGNLAASCGVIEKLIKAPAPFISASVADALIEQGLDIDQARSIYTTPLCSHLNQLEERPWSGWSKGSGIKAADVARLLKPFGITSRQRRDPDTGKNLRGYLRADCVDAFERYLPATVTPIRRYTPVNSDISPGDAASNCSEVASGTATNSRHEAA